MVRMIAMFSLPPMKPASTPSVPPIRVAKTTGTTPISSDMRPP